MYDQAKLVDAAKYCEQQANLLQAQWDASIRLARQRQGLEGHTAALTAEREITRLRTSLPPPHVPEICRELARRFKEIHPSLMVPKRLAMKAITPDHAAAILRQEERYLRGFLDPPPAKPAADPTAAQ